MRSVISKAFVAVATLFLVLPAASAHEQAVAFTEVLIVPNGESSDCSVDGCRVEVAHRLAIHDAESTLMNVLGARADLYADREAQMRFEAYVADRFSLKDARSGEASSLTLLGGEVERGYYWVYQEGEIDASSDAIEVMQSVLMDAIPRQTNRVNIRHDRQTKTLVFRAGEQAQVYRIR